MNCNIVLLILIKLEQKLCFLKTIGFENTGPKTDPPVLKTDRP